MNIPIVSHFDVKILMLYYLFYNYIYIFILLNANLNVILSMCRDVKCHFDSKIIILITLKKP